MSWIERERKVILVGLLVSLVAGAIVFLIRLPPAESIQIVLPPPTDTPSPTTTPGPVRVYVCGAVKYPDVYELPAGSIVKDAIIAAGGAAGEADLNQINLAQELADQTQIYIPTQGEELDSASASTPAFTTSRSLHHEDVININTASLAELESLPGIGPVLAQRIVDHRPYRTLEDILDVPGIGEATYEKLKDGVVVQ